MNAKWRFGRHLGGVALLAVFLAAILLGDVASAHGVPQEDLQALERGGSLAYVWLGAKHMLLTGYDHLLFIFGVIFFLTRVRDVVRFITAFTIGHSITLTLGTLLSIRVNYHIIDAIIALTVCYKALENIDGFRRYFNVATPSLIAAVFVFGLIHGLGLATRLQQVPLPQDGLIPRILAFNLGVELGQIAALTVMVGLLAAWRRRPVLILVKRRSGRGWGRCHWNSRLAVSANRDAVRSRDSNLHASLQASDHLQRPRLPRHGVSTGTLDQQWILSRNSLVRTIPFWLPSPKNAPGRQRNRDV